MNELNLSHNKLAELPNVAKWSSELTVFDISYNELSDLPITVTVPSIQTLNLSNNRFRTVPLCVCSFTSLQYLDISFNEKIQSLPIEMGRLSNLSKLVMDGLNHLTDPPRNIQDSTRDCIHHLNRKLRSLRNFYQMKMLVVGNTKRGKTTLVARLQGLDVDTKHPIVGIGVSEWQYSIGLGRQKYLFNVWDVGGLKEECHAAINQCFFSGGSMYLLLWNVKHGEEGIAELKPWLDSIALRAPPRSCVFIIGTHLDLVGEEELPKVDILLGKVANIAQTYGNKLVIPEILAVGLMNQLKNISVLRKLIYNQACTYQHPIMSREIPKSFVLLNKEMKEVQKEVHRGLRDPVMHIEQFKAFVHALKLADIESDNEVRAAMNFLNDVGTILYYDDISYGLDQIYFIDPSWLCKMMLEIVTNPFIRNGILQSHNIPSLFRNMKFQWEYYGHYLFLLNRFEIALPLSSHRVLIPSMLPNDRPDEANICNEKSSAPLYIRYITIPLVPSGFWSRLISHVMHAIPQVYQALDILADSHKYNIPYDKKLSVELEKVPRREASVEKVGSSPALTQTQLGFLLPRVTNRFITPGDKNESLCSSDFKLIYWKEGVVYKESDVSFSVESLQTSKFSPHTSRDGIVILASPNEKGMRLMCTLIDITVSLIHEWYPGLREFHNQRVPCYECCKLGRKKPFEFEVDRYLSSISRSCSQIECEYNKDETENHQVSLVDIMPDLLLLDLHVKLLKPQEIEYEDDNTALLGKGAFANVHRGTYKGKSVAIKKFLLDTSESFIELRSNVKTSLKHSCIVSLVGVSVQPFRVLILEIAPMGSLEKHLMKVRTAIPRLVMFRIAAQVAAALRFLHQHGIIYRDIKASKVLLWSLDETSLCHSKISGSSIATHLSPVGTVGIMGAKSFVAPEVLSIRKKRAVYNHKADIFSFGMLLYQMITRRHPYHNIQPVKIDAKVVKGDRPSFIDTYVAEMGFIFLTRLMERCWIANPDERPDTSELITDLSKVIFQSIIGFHPICSRFSLRQGCVVTTHNSAKNVCSSNELWICCDGSEGSELNIYNTERMIKMSKCFIKENQIQCMSVCGDHIWLCSRAGIEFGVIDIFNINSRELVHNVRLRENTVSCITSSNSVVFLGTIEGYCFSFDIDIKAIQRNSKPKYCYVSDHTIDGIIVTDKHVWVSHTYFVSFLNLQNLQLEHSHERSPKRDAFMGNLVLSSHGIVWSGHLGGRILSAWDANKETHLYDLDVCEVMLKNVCVDNELDSIMTCMTVAYDVVWVGMATGHILLFHRQDLVMFYHPYKEYVRFLIAIPCREGPCQEEKCMVVSGAKGFQSPLENYPTQELQLQENSGVLVLIEAYSSTTLHQMKVIEDQSLTYLDNRKTIAHMIKSLHFKDDTNILEEINNSATIDTTYAATNQDHKEGSSSDKMLCTPAQTQLDKPAVVDSETPFSHHTSPLQQTEAEMESKQ